MLTYRSFRNTDPPVLTDLWQSLASPPGRLPSVNPDLLERLVFSKLYFDYEGLILAWEDNRAVGFAHAGFGATECEEGVSTELGTTYLVTVRPDCDEATVAAGLLERSEAYLRKRGAKVLYGGGILPLNAFYLGLYGGSELPGILDSDTVAQRAFAAAGYREIDRTILFQQELATFESAVDRRQMQIRRQMVAQVVVDPPTRTWWEACTLGPFDLVRFELVPRSGGPAVASATFRSMEVMPALLQPRTVGLMEVRVDEAFRRRGLSVFLLSEAFRQFMREGTTTVEIQAMQHNIAALNLYQKLGFKQIGHGSVLRKE